MIITADLTASLSKLLLIALCQTSVIELCRGVYLITAFAYVAGLADAHQAMIRVL